MIFRKIIGVIVSPLIAAAVVAVFSLSYLLLQWLFKSANSQPSFDGIPGYFLVVLICSTIGGVVAVAFLFPLFSLLMRFKKLTLTTALMVGLIVCVVWYSSIGLIAPIFGFTDPNFLPFSMKAVFNSEKDLLFSVLLIIIHAISLSLILARIAFRIPIFKE
jgi:hypothetical protein